jgi:hypothetical protein
MFRRAYWLATKAGGSASFNQQIHWKQAYARTVLGLARLTLKDVGVREDELDWKQRCDASGSTARVNQTRSYAYESESIIGEPQAWPSPGQFPTLLFFYNRCKMPIKLETGNSGAS